MQKKKKKNGTSTHLDISTIHVERKIIQMVEKKCFSKCWMKISQCEKKIEKSLFTFKIDLYKGYLQNCQNVKGWSETQLNSSFWNNNTRVKLNNWY